MNSSVSEAASFAANAYAHFKELFEEKAEELRRHHTQALAEIQQKTLSAFDVAIDSAVKQFHLRLVSVENQLQQQDVVQRPILDFKTGGKVSGLHLGRPTKFNSGFSRVDFSTVDFYNSLEFSENFTESSGSETCASPHKTSLQPPQQELGSGAHALSVTEDYGLSSEISSSVWGPHFHGHSQGGVGVSSTKRPRKLDSLNSLDSTVNPHSKLARQGDKSLQLDLWPIGGTQPVQDLTVGLYSAELDQATSQRMAVGPVGPSSTASRDLIVRAPGFEVPRKTKPSICVRKIPSGYSIEKDVSLQKLLAE